MGKQRRSNKKTLAKKYSEATTEFDVSSSGASLFTTNGTNQEDALQVRCKCVPQLNGFNTGEVELFLPKSIPCFCNIMKVALHDRPAATITTNRKEASEEQQAEGQEIQVDRGVMLNYLLRPWQNKFLKETFNITTSSTFMGLYKNHLDLLVKVMRSWCKLNDLAFVSKKKCQVCLHIWSKTCLSVHNASSLIPGTAVEDVLHLIMVPLPTNSKINPSTTCIKSQVPALDAIPVEYVENHDVKRFNSMMNNQKINESTVALVTNETSTTPWETVGYSFNTESTEETDDNYRNEDVKSNQSSIKTQEAHTQANDKTRNQQSTCQTTDDDTSKKETTSRKKRKSLTSLFLRTKLASTYNSLLTNLSEEQELLSVDSEKTGRTTSTTSTVVTTESSTRSFSSRSSFSNGTSNNDSNSTINSGLLLDQNDYNGDCVNDHNPIAGRQVPSRKNRINNIHAAIMMNDRIHNKFHSNDDSLSSSAHSLGGREFFIGDINH